MIKNRIAKLIRFFVERSGGEVIYYDSPFLKEHFNSVKGIRECLFKLKIKPPRIHECLMLKFCTEKTSGNIAEVGVYKGASAYLISHFKKERQLYLFDTFNGLPELSEYDSSFFKKGAYSGNKQAVENLLSNFENIYVTKGLFPETAGVIKEKKFGFLHLDVDLYQGTKDSLEFFYPRMTERGIILIHDYWGFSEGVKKAVDDFFKDKPEQIIETVGRYCVISKNKNIKLH